MRRLIAVALLAALGFASSGCINAYSANPNVRTQQLINQSEDLRQIGNEWQRIWFTDQPSHMTPERVHGGIQ
jgi:hypothetical protein